MANAVFPSGHIEVGSKSVEGQQTRTTCAAGSSSCWRVKSVAGATLIGAGSKQRRKSPLLPPTLKFPMASLIGRAEQGESWQRKSVICRGSAPVSESRVRRRGKLEPRNNGLITSNPPGTRHSVSFVLFFFKFIN